MTDLMESMLTEYFTVRVVLGKFLTAREEVFRLFGSIYLQPKEEVERVFPLTERSEIETVSSLHAYMQFCRLSQYRAMLGEEEGMDEVQELIAVKGAAIEAAHANKLLSDGERTRTALTERLSACVGAGNVPAMRLVGILMCEGIFLDRDVEAGTALLEKSARWNSAESVLALLYYGRMSPEAGTGLLKRLLLKNSRSSAYEAVARKYGAAEGRESAEADLLERLFDAGKLSRGTYSEEYARVLFSSAVDGADKERLTVHTEKGTVSELGDLPLGLVPASGTVRPLSPVLGREREGEAVFRRLQDLDLVRRDPYRPLCLCSESAYLLRAYASAVENSLDGVRAVRLFMSGLDEYDFEPTRHHVFVRSCKEDAVNAYLLFLCGDVRERAVRDVKAFLQTSSRRAFRLLRPAVTLDLSPILPICFADEKNSAWLEKYCDVVHLAAVSQGEKLTLIGEMLRRRGEAYGLSGVTLTREARDRLACYSPDLIDGVLERAVCDNRHAEESVVLTEAVMCKYIEEAGVRRVPLGFGGSYEDR